MSWERHRTLLLGLTGAASAIDALSFVHLGKVFTSFMSGNVLFLGPGADDADAGLVIRAGVALAAFFAGAVGGAVARAVSGAARGDRLRPSDGGAHDVRREHHGRLVLAVQRGAIDGERLAAIAGMAGPPRLERSARLVGGERPGVDEVLDAGAAQEGRTEHVAIVLAGRATATGLRYRLVAEADRTSFRAHADPRAHVVHVPLRIPERRLALRLRGGRRVPRAYEDRCGPGARSTPCTSRAAPASRSAASSWSSLVWFSWRSPIAATTDRLRRPRRPWAERRVRVGRRGCSAVGRPDPQLARPGVGRRLRPGRGHRDQRSCRRGLHALHGHRADGSTHTGTLGGVFAEGDLAVVSVTGAKLRPARFADSAKVRTGEYALAIRGWAARTASHCSTERWSTIASAERGPTGAAS